jgi:molybdopterin synthase sulfur carrier subunit
MKVLYFARFRQVIGRGSDEIAVPEGCKTVRELIDFLMARDEAVAAAFGDLRTVKVAINQSHAGFDAALDGAREVAFFPPVTGG